MKNRLLTALPLNEKVILNDNVIVKNLVDCVVLTINEFVVVKELPIEYSKFITSLIRVKYSEDKAEAIMANYLLIGTGTVSEEKAMEYTEEYQEYQSWRLKVKDIAKEIFGLYATDTDMEIELSTIDQEGGDYAEA